MSENKSNQDLENFRKALEKTTEKDFDGHTDFESLSVKDKLIWLSELNYFRYIASK